MQATFHPISAYDPKVSTGIVLLDRFAPPSPPATDSIWIEPPRQNRPSQFEAPNQTVKLKRWNADHPLGAGLRTKDLEFSNAEIFRMDRDDIPVAESEAGPLIVARPGKHKTVVFGFHPVRSGMKYELTTPLLFANILRWMAPDIFRSWELTAGTVGTVDVNWNRKPIHPACKW